LTVQKWNSILNRNPSREGEGEARKEVEGEEEHNLEHRRGQKGTRNLPCIDNGHSKNII